MIFLLEMELKIINKKMEKKLMVNFREKEKKKDKRMELQEMNKMKNSLDLRNRLRENLQASSCPRQRILSR